MRQRKIKKKSFSYKRRQIIAVITTDRKKEYFSRNKSLLMTWGKNVILDVTSIAQKKKD